MAQSRTTLIGWIITAVIIIGGITGLIFLSRGPSGGAGNLPAVTADDHLQGPASAPAIVVAYSDFQCPACLAYEPILKSLKTEFGDQLTIVYRHYPLKSIHKYAEAAARASEAAQLQGQFWEMHDLLYDRQKSWTGSSSIDETLAGYAEELGLDVEKFKTDYAGEVVKARVNRDVNGGLSLGVNGTPTFYLNGDKISNPNSQQAFSDLIRTKIPK